MAGPMVGILAEWTVLKRLASDLLGSVPTPFLPDFPRCGLRRWVLTDLRLST